MAERIKLNEGETIKFESMPTWQEEFNRKFKYLNSSYATEAGLVMYESSNDIKAFIQSTLDRQKKELLEKIRLKEKDADINNVQVGNFPSAINYHYSSGYNQAVADLEELKKNL
jgi:Fe-S cluster assembly scaffold protein SufB